MIKKIIPVDFETVGIEQRPKYPPSPCGVAVQIDGVNEYLAWNHPKGNNIKKREAVKILKDVYKNSIPVFHNSEFDLDVGATHLGLPMPKEFHDTLFLAYLYDPRSTTLSLKPLADMHLDLPAEEQDELKQWILDNIEGAHDSKNSKHPELFWAGLMHLAPVEIVGRYAKGDILRTEGLYNFYMPYILEHGMLEAYEREKQVMPIFMDMSKKGIRVNKTKLVKDKKQFEKDLIKYEKQIIKRLGAPKDINIGSGAQLADAMDKAGVVSHWIKTPKGNRSTSRDNLELVCTDEKLLDLLQVHGILSKYVSTFINNWITPDGRIYPNFNQVRTPDEHGKVFGTRTGRPSSNNPNFLNVPRNVEDTRLPNLRDYILPDVEHSLDLRDYCFSNDTEVLTDEGFKLFTNLTGKEKLAQWDDTEITFTKPLNYQNYIYKGEMVNIVGKDSCDLFVTPDHDCLQLNSKGEPVKIKAMNYKIGHYKQLVAGTYNTVSGNVSGILLKLVAAIQADCKIDKQKQCTKAIFYLKKQRKIERLIDILSMLDVEYVIAETPSKKGFKVIRFVIPEDVINFLDYDTKLFKRSLVSLSFAHRQLFLEELQYWNGTSQGSSWKYSNTKLGHFSLLQELCVLSGIRSKLYNEKVKGDRKKCYSLSMVYKNSVDTKMFTKTVHTYNDTVHCVTMPKGTVIVRRNGKVSITGQCQQEFRILAHYEEGALCNSYHNDPDTDAHTLLQRLIKEILHVEYDRHPVKTINFGKIYGMGKPALSKKLKAGSQMITDLIKAHAKAFPDVIALDKALKKHAKAGNPIYTWGGREYYVEEDSIINGRRRTWEYKMLNYLIQGSAADVTKEAMIRVNKAIKGTGARIILQVYDELVVSVPKGKEKEVMILIRDAMESVELDVPLLSDGKIGKTSWGKAKKVKY